MASSGPDEFGGDGEQSRPQSLGLPPASGFALQGEHLHPGGRLTRECDDGTPDLVLGEIVEREVRQTGVLRAPDPVLGTGTLAVPQVKIGQLAVPAAGGGVGGECGHPVAVVVSQP